MQDSSDLYLWAGAFIIAGIALVILGLVAHFRNQQNEGDTESKGVILLGPIPIVWGFGEKSHIISIVLVIALILLYLLIFL